MKNEDKANIYNTLDYSSNALNILVVGATGGTGRAVVEKLLTAGHKVTAFSRSANLLDHISEQLCTINGDANNPMDIEKAVQNQDVVIVTLGINENPLRVRFFGSARTVQNIRSAGTRNVINAMHKHGVQRLIVQSSYGVGDTRGLLSFFDQLFFSLILKPQIDDTEAQESLVKKSGLDWVLVRPVHLTNESSYVSPFVSENGETRKMKVARLAVASFLTRATQEPTYIGKSVAVSG
ncbi:MAG: SDR family oxidoreductase [Gammaproteobacteria bacterium]|nr:SDR family oxidoreductase [Gammaproteobacteria bacterium]